MIPPTLPHLPVIFPFPHPNFPCLTPTQLSDLRSRKSHFLPSPPTCQYSLTTPTPFPPEHTPWQWIYLCDYLILVSLLHLAVTCKRVVTVSLIHKKYGTFQKINDLVKPGSRKLQVQCFYLCMFSVFLHFFFLSISQYFQNPSQYLRSSQGETLED